LCEAATLGLDADKQEISMNTIDAIRFLSDDELAAVVGGRMNIPRPDTHPQNGVPGSNGKGGDVAFLLGITALLIVAGVVAD
jgi:hypothetical protein